MKRGELPGSGHFLKRRDFMSGSDTSEDFSSFLAGNTPTISPAIALDEDGQDISINLNISPLTFSLFFDY